MIKIFHQIIGGTMTYKIFAVISLTLFSLICYSYSADEKTINEPLTFQLFSNKSSFSIGGFMQINYSYESDKNTNNEFKIRRARLDFRGNAESIFKWKIQVDAVQTVKEINLSQQQTQKVVIRPILLDAYIDYALNKYISFRIGQFKIPFSTENLQSSSDLDLINRSQLVEKIVPGRDIGSQGRDIGIVSAIEYKFKNEHQKLKLSAGIFNGNGINIGDDNSHKDFVYRFEISPTKGLSMALSQYFGKSGLNEADRNRIGFDFNLDIKNISFKGEYAYGKDNLIEKQGWYLQTKYKINSLLDLIFRIDALDPNKLLTNDKTTIFVLGINYYPYKRVKLQFNYLRNVYESEINDSNSILSNLQIVF